MNVATAARVFGSEINLALIRFYREHPGTGQVAASTALQIPHPLVSTTIRMLISTGVIVEEQPPSGRRQAQYVVDEARFLELVDALKRYALHE